MNIIWVKHIKGHLLEMKFSNGVVKKVDLSIFLKSAVNPMTLAYRKVKRFKEVKVLHGNLSWNEEMDLSGESLYNWKD